jgi:hypothetical protein
MKLSFPLFPPTLLFWRSSPLVQDSNSSTIVASSSSSSPPTWRFRLLQLEVIAVLSASCFVYYSFTRYLADRDERRRRLEEAKQLIWEERKSTVKRILLFTGSALALATFTTIGVRVNRWLNQSFQETKQNQILNHLATTGSQS